MQQQCGITDRLEGSVTTAQMHLRLQSAVNIEQLLLPKLGKLRQGVSSANTPALEIRLLVQQLLHPRWLYGESSSTLSLLQSDTNVIPNLARGLGFC